MWLLINCARKVRMRAEESGPPLAPVGSKPSMCCGGHGAVSARMKGSIGRSFSVAARYSHSVIDFSAVPISPAGRFFALLASGMKP